MTRLGARLYSLIVALTLIAAPIHAHPSAEHRIEVLSEAIKENPKDQRLHIQRGQAHSNEGLLDLALADLRMAEKLGDPVLAAYDLGVVLYQKGKLEGARQALDRFLARFPQHPSALGYRARVLRDAGATAEALADYEAYFAVQKSPNPGDYVAAANLLSEGKGKDVDRALGLLDRGILKIGVVPQLQQRAIEIARTDGRFEAAIQRHLTLEPALGKSPEWKVAMATMLVEAGREEEANRYYDLAAKQLDALRPTKSRRALRERLDRLRGVGRLSGAE